MGIDLEVLGGGQEVGRSSFLVDSGEKFLLDHGIKLSAEEIGYPLPLKTHLDAAILSHAHLDHSGNIPALFVESKTLLYLTAPTLDLSRMLWFDTLKIADAEGVPAAFSMEEIEKATKYSFTLDYKRQLQITDNASLQMFDAGHILGAALVKLTTKNKSILYTGDFKLHETRLFKGADFDSVGNVDYLIIESTYGDRDHPPREEVEKEFVDAIMDTVNRGGHVLLPAFALGRSQEVLDILYEHNVDVPVYLDGMAKKASQIFIDYKEYFRKPKILNKMLHSATWVKNNSARKKALKEPSIIVTPAGMLAGGPAIFYLPHIYNDPNSSIFLTGYQVKDTPGRVLLETGEFGIEERMEKVRAKVRKFDFSAHPGKQELMHVINKLNPEKVICVHGDPEIASLFKSDLKKEGFEAFSPKNGDRVKLDK